MAQWKWIIILLEGDRNTTTLQIAGESPRRGVDMTLMIVDITAPSKVRNTLRLQLQSPREAIAI
jgi:hypothetical protein